MRLLKWTCLSVVVLCKISNAQTVSALAGSAGYQHGYTNGSLTGALFYEPWGVCVNATGDVFVADKNNNCIRKITRTGTVTTFAGSATGAIGSADGQGTAASFFHPSAICVDGSGNIYVMDEGNYKVRKIDINGNVSTLAGSGSNGNSNGTGTAASFAWARGICVDKTGTTLYVADSYNNLIRKINISTKEVTNYAGSGVAGNQDGIENAASFYSPEGICIDPSGNLYVADRNNSIIRKIATDKSVTTLAGQAVQTGAADGSGAAARFNNPRGIAFVNGDLYVADFNNNTIRKVTLSGTVTTLAGRAGSFGNNNGAVSSANFSNPNYIGSDPTNNDIYVTDALNQNIRKISPIISTPTPTPTPTPTTGSCTLDCQKAFTNNPLLMQNQLVVCTVVMVPYKNGNGGPTSVPGVQSVMIPSTGVSGLKLAGPFESKFSTCDGNLTYQVIGTPTSSGTASFAISIGGSQCTLRLQVQ